jgi:hypothetical protein
MTSSRNPTNRTDRSTPRAAASRSSSARSGPSPTITRVTASRPGTALHIASRRLTPLMSSSRPTYSTTGPRSPGLDAVPGTVPAPPVDPAKRTPFGMSTRRSPAMPIPESRCIISVETATRTSQVRSRSQRRRRRAIPSAARAVTACIPVTLTMTGLPRTRPTIPAVSPAEVLCAWITWKRRRLTIAQTRNDSRNDQRDAHGTSGRATRSTPSSCLRDVVRHPGDWFTTTTGSPARATSGARSLACRCAPPTEPSRFARSMTTPGPVPLLDT